MNTERPYGEKLLKSEEILFSYIDWLYNTGRLTTEEHSKLVEATVDYGMRAQEFGYSGESA